METKATPSIVSVEKIDDSLLIEFADGKSALYSASLLYASLPKADAVKTSASENNAEADG